MQTGFQKISHRLETRFVDRLCGCGSGSGGTRHAEAKLLEEFIPPLWGPQHGRTGF